MPPTPSAALLRHSATALLRRGSNLATPQHALARLPRALSSALFHTSPAPRLPVPAAKKQLQRPIVVNFPSGEEKELDHCHCAECVNQDTLQRSFDSFTITDKTPQNVRSKEDGLEVIWQETGHKSFFSWEWLATNMHKKPSAPKYTFWGAEIAKSPPDVHYDEVMASDTGVGKWTAKILKHGFCFVDGCPVSPEKTEELLNRIAFIRETHYGAFYDFTSDLTMKDTAYTTLALPAHTDTTYFTDPSGLQLFHLLSHSGHGGASLLVDGFSCASQLLSRDPRAYDILSRVPVPWHASGNEGVVITPATWVPVLTLDGEGGVRQLRWNNDDRASMPVENAGVEYEEWFEAARVWNEIITEGRNEYWGQLVPGRPVIFDNWRVMHARSAFEGKRRMCGGYINRDDFISRYWNTNFSREEVLKRII
ncbi:hypothetical protein GMDG_05332 [Pseudogymnoascus destructans 20631-21]|uniref:trimethyllysine dioxygenase n=1 Tax=Pseudogymnoascus destructans (strain ATCC MYA-4855 / 20631-21) TaxID=658429 RepID=L8FMX0_PSED2|nr:hypothetical protein GMDG_05332 [Pseudogymnoascus destructans 20631-21]